MGVVTVRLGWHIGLPGPFYLGGTLWHSPYRRRYRTLDCGHAHRSQAAYDSCPTRGHYPAKTYTADVNAAWSARSTAWARGVATLLMLAFAVGVAVHYPWLLAVYAVVVVIAVIRRRRRRGTPHSPDQHPTGR